MKYLLFKQKMDRFGCFSNHQVKMVFPDFDRNNLTRWVKKGWLIRLRQGLYTFPEYKEKSRYVYYFANRMYSPSYISLHTALSFYGLIPEAVLDMTSVTSLKTAVFKNEFGNFVYKSVKEDLFFGYDLKKSSADIEIKLAKPEKAILDLLYLYPFYNNEKEIRELRFDEYFLNNELDLKLLKDYSARFKNKALDKRTRKFIKVYDL